MTAARDSLTVCGAATWLTCSQRTAYTPQVGLLFFPSTLVTAHVRQSDSHCSNFQPLCLPYIHDTTRSEKIEKEREERDFTRILKSSHAFIKDDIPSLMKFEIKLKQIEKIYLKLTFFCLHRLHMRWHEFNQTLYKKLNLASFTW